MKSAVTGHTLQKTKILCIWWQFLILSHDQCVLTHLHGSNLLCLLNNTVILPYCVLKKSIARFISKVTSSSSLSLKNCAFPSCSWTGCGRWRPSLLKRGKTSTSGRAHMWEKGMLIAGSSLLNPKSGKSSFQKGREKGNLKSISYCFGVRRSRNFSFTSRTTSVTLVSGSLIFTWVGKSQHLYISAMCRFP